MAQLFFRLVLIISFAGNRSLNPAQLIIKSASRSSIVSSVLLASEKRPEVKIDWRIYTKNPDSPLIRDLIIEGLSLARTQKEEFSSILNSNDGNINALFKVLEEFSKD